MVSGPLTLILPEKDFDQHFKKLLGLLAHKTCPKRIKIILPSLSVEQGCQLGEALTDVAWSTLWVVIKKASLEQEAYFELLFKHCIQGDFKFILLNDKLYHKSSPKPDIPVEPATSPPAKPLVFSNYFSQSSMDKLNLAIESLGFGETKQRFSGISLGL